MKLVKIIILVIAFIAINSRCKKSASTNTNTSTSTQTLSKGSFKPNVHSGVQHMVVPIPSNQLPLSSYFSPAQRDSLINNYWDYKGEKSYSTITVDDLTKLFNSTEDTTKILIKVSKIEDKTNVKIEWLAFDSTLFQKDELEQLHYFIFERQYYDETHDIDHKVPAGIKFASEGDSITNAITARLGKDRNNYCIILNSTFVYFLNKQKGLGSSHGGDAGIKIPPPQQ